MPEYEFSRGTQILLVATVVLVIDLVVNIMFISGGPGTFFAIFAVIFSSIATYAAAKYMDMAAFDGASGTEFLSSQYLGEMSAALLWGIMATFIIAFDVLIWILALSSLGSDFKDIWYIALALSLIGGGLALFGSIVAKREWDG